MSFTTFESFGRALNLSEPQSLALAERAGVRILVRNGVRVLDDENTTRLTRAYLGTLADGEERDVCSPMRRSA